MKIMCGIDSDYLVWQQQQAGDPRTPCRQRLVEGLHRCAMNLQLTDLQSVATPVPPRDSSSWHTQTEGFGPSLQP